MLAKVLQSFFWYTDNAKMDKTKDKKRIILHILNYGDNKAVSWLFKNYSKAVIKNTIINYGGHGELDKKSLNYWCLYLHIKPSQIIKTRL